MTVPPHPNQQPAKLLGKLSGSRIESGNKTRLLEQLQQVHLNITKMVNVVWIKINCKYFWNLLNFDAFKGDA
jgi:hypothetical protein